MKLVLIFGPQAVGKMTVGQELAKKTGLKLFHNHMTIELLEPLFGFSAEMWRLTDLFRMEIFKSAAVSEMEGLIFTYVWAFDQQEDWASVDKICRVYESKGADIYFIELEAELDKRLQRNKSPNRLQHKPTKRDVMASEAELINSMQTYRLNSYEGEIERENYIKIDNTDLCAEEVAEIIRKKFQL
jgi:hypothetical protein